MQCDLIGWVLILLCMILVNQRPPPSSLWLLGWMSVRIQREDERAVA